MADMDTYVVPATFPDLDTAKRDTSTLVDALRTAGLHAEVVEGAELDSADDAGHSADDAGRRDPGPTTRELRVRAGSVEEARHRVQGVVDGQFPPGMVLLGEPMKV